MPRRTPPSFPQVGRYQAGTRPQRLAPGVACWRRFPNRNGGSIAVNPVDTASHLSGITFAGGEFATVTYIEKEAFVDVIHFQFVTGNAVSYEKPA